MKNAIGGAVMLLAAAGLGGCAYPVGPHAYHGYEAGAEQTVRFGVVESLKPVRIQVRDSGVGTAAGAVIGSVAGSHVGGGSGQIVGAIGGAILGGIVGQDIERANNERAGVELTVLLDSGRYISVVQPEDEPFRAGDRVRILSGRGSTRVTH
jgi:outer membrane lipoprotein SlyB